MEGIFVEVYRDLGKVLVVELFEQKIDQVRISWGLNMGWKPRPQADDCDDSPTSHRA